MEHRVEPLNEYFGAVVSGCDLGAGRADEIRSLLYRSKVLVIKGVALEAEAYIAFARQMGSIVHFVDPDYHHPDHPEIFVVSNLQKEGLAYGKDRVGYYWHSDSSFMPSPLPLTMLHVQVAPDDGGQTAFIDMGHVYDGLPPELRRIADTCQARHESKWKYLVTPRDIGLSIDEILERDEQEVPSCVHPMVITHPAAGSRALYFSQGITRRVLGIPLDESEAVLQELEKRVTGDDSQYEHRWEPGDLVMWDNRSVVHRAYPAAPGGRRLMYRIGVRDGDFNG